MSESFDLRGRTLCSTCCDSFVEEKGTQILSSLVRHVDPTICTHCGADNGDVACEKIQHRAFCPSCVSFFRNRPYPRWVQMFFLALAILVLISFGWNWRFFQGHFEAKAAFAAIDNGDMAEAVTQMSAAAAHVPESPDLRQLSFFFEGLLYLNDDCEKAEGCFQKCTQLPPEYGVSYLRQRAAAGAAFDRKDYDRFLQIAQEMANESPQDATAQAQVASALACLYALRGDAEFRRQAEAKLEAAKAIDKQAIEETRYEERIRHRLQTREIIDTKEYFRRFPDAPAPLKQTKT